MAKIYVVVRGGNIQNIFGSEGIEVRVIDYDNLEAMPEDDIGRDEFKDDLAELERALKAKEVTHLH